MASLSYEEIFSDFLGSVTDYQIAALDNADANELMTEYLHKAVADTYIRSLFSSVSLDDETLEITYVMQNVVDEQTDSFFVKNILSKEMVVEWLRPQVRNRINTAQMFAGKEQKFYAQSSHLSELRGLLEDTELDVQKAIRDRGYIYNTYLED